MLCGERIVPVTRRTFLETLGLAGMALPVLQSRPRPLRSYVWLRPNLRKTTGRSEA